MESQDNVVFQFLSSQVTDMQSQMKDMKKEFAEERRVDARVIEKLRKQITEIEKRRGAEERKYVKEVATLTAEKSVMQSHQHVDVSTLLKETDQLKKKVAKLRSVSADLKKTTSLGILSLFLCVIRSSNNFC